jgi:hypothetical protein
LSEVGVKYLQGIFNQLELHNGKYQLKYHWFGQKNRYGQSFLIRNCFFEPSVNPEFNWLDDCLRRINIAFTLNKPAIICTHRLNFIGALSVTNRDQIV